MKKIVIICKGGFGTEMQDYLSDTFAADSGYRFDRIRDLFPEDELIVQPDEVFVVANGDPVVKGLLVNKIEQAGGQLLSVIHPTCYVAKSATIGAGAILCPFVFVGPHAVIAPHVTMNVHAGCGHNAKIGSFTVLSPYASVAGAAEIGEGVFFGSYAFVAPEKRVGNHAKLSAGAFALADVPDKALALGNPARVIANYYA
jgi:carbonic anhydrase/acetyltransferase-like protein (isoleucine patch superfamily)